ncbi:MAG TPA: prephenate dehydrogenase/arogenate dehydrogenase family protein [Longimicrobium sp.]|jgi:prephenate dehydrogenase
MTGVRSAAVIGLGLIGGSVARDLVERGVRVLGYDRDPATVRDALRDGGIHEVLGSRLEGTEAVDLVMVAVPVTAAADVLRKLRVLSTALLTDVGSTKESIARAAEEVALGEQFVGSHPLAGDHRSGWSASRTGLFRGARVFLTPTTRTTLEALERARALWTSLGAHTEVMDAAEHDRRMAAVSHLPQALATALGSLLAHERLGRGDLGPGARDMTRLAGSSPEMWAAIAADNARHLSASVGAMQERLAGLRDALDAGDAERLRSFFEEGNRWFREDER